MEKQTTSSGRRKNNQNAEGRTSAGKSPGPSIGARPGSADRLNHSKRSAAHRSPSSSSSNSPHSPVISVQLWLKSDVFTFGALQVPPHNRIVFENLKKLVNYTYVKNQAEFPKLRFPTWRHVACDKLGMAPEVAWIYFETYDMMRDLAVPQIGKVFDEALASVKVVNGGGGAGDATPTSSNFDGTSKDEVWVDVRRFALLLGIQRIHKISLRSSLTMGDEWPSSGQPPSSPRPLPSHSTRSSSVPDAEACLAFFLTYLNEFIDLLLTPISAAPASTAVGASFNRSSSSTTSLSLEAVESLGFLVGVKLTDHRNNTKTLLNLHEIATYPALHGLAGYDPSSKSFDYRLFEEWFRASIIPDPFSLPAVSSTGTPLPWLLSPSSSDVSTRSSVSRLSANQIVSNLNLAPRPREKLVHISGVVKETLARSDDDERLTQCSPRLHRCRDSNFYFLAPIRTALIVKCKNLVVVLGCVETTVHLTGCENVTLIACCRRLSVAVSKRCVFHLLTPSSPLVLGYNENLTFAPYHTSYPELNRHLDLCNIGASVNRWNRPYVMGAVSADAEAKSWKLIDPADFVTFVIPFEKPSREKSQRRVGGGGGGGGGGDASSSMTSTTSSAGHLGIPGGLPEEYKAALDLKVTRFAGLREKLTTEERHSARPSNDLNRVVRGRFLDWMMSNGRHKELKALAALEVSSNYDVEN